MLVDHHYPNGTSAGQGTSGRAPIWLSGDDATVPPLTRPPTQPSRPGNPTRSADVGAGAARPARHPGVLADDLQLHPDRQGHPDRLTDRLRQIDRAAGDAAEQVAGAVQELAAHWPPASSQPPLIETWRGLAAVARIDLAVARLLEGHVDAVRILAEAGRTPRPGCVYGVWASASGGTGLTGQPRAGGWLVDGTMRFCSGAWFIDRALVVISTPEGKRLVDLDVRDSQGLTRREDTWPAVGMDVTRSVDLQVEGLRIEAGDAVADPGFYLDRPGFTIGGVGVAAVWLGGAAGVLDALVQELARSGRSSAHQRAHLGAMVVSLTAADALLGELAARLDRGGPLPELSAADGLAARSAVEQAVDVVLGRAPRVAGPTPLCRDAEIAHRLADLGVYVRQHHAEGDYEQLGAHLLESGRLLGRAIW
jgi:alkylation response protein AidB-like acyl-CoA dehydrogenase